MSKKDKKNEAQESVEQEELQSAEEVLESDVQPQVQDEESVDELSELKQKVAELEDRYLRANADFENIKKRVEKEKSQAVNYANELFARDMLSIIDALDAAASLKESEETKPEEMFIKIKEGIDLTVEQCKKAFEKHGVALIDTDCEFDPNFHEAVMQVDSDEKNSGEILQVFQKGYKIKQRVLRPAMVSIVK